MQGEEENLNRIRGLVGPIVGQDLVAVNKWSVLLLWTESWPSNSRPVAVMTKPVR
jgi:hypothetical protein